MPADRAPLSYDDVMAIHRLIRGAAKCEPEDINAVVKADEVGLLSAILRELIDAVIQRGRKPRSSD